MTQRTRRLGWLVTLASVTAIAWLTLTPAPSSGWGGYEPPWWCLWCGNLGLVDIAANIVLFVPLGAGLRLLGIKGWQMIVAAIAVTMGIEALQLSLVPGRDANVRDVLTNTLGAALGFALLPSLPRVVFPSPRAAAGMAPLIAALWIASRVATGALLQPSPPSGSLVVQIAPTSVYPSNFDGTIHDAALNGVAVGIGRLRSQDSFVARWERDTLVVEAVATSRVASENLASIVSVLTRWRQEAFVFGAEGRHLVLRARMRAADYQLRSPSIHLADAIAVGEPLALRGAIEGARVVLSARSARGAQEASVSLSAGLGWILISPFDWPLDAYAPWWSGVLASLWAGVIGWYARRAGPFWWALCGVAAAGLLGAMLPPVLVSAADVPLPEWLGMAVGGLCGVTLAQRLSFRGRLGGAEGAEGARFP